MTKNEHYLSVAATALANMKRLYRIYHKAQVGIEPPGMSTITFDIAASDITDLKQEFASQRTLCVDNLGFIGEAGEEEYDPSEE